MPFFIVRNDVTKMTCDAIVNAANETLLGGGGVDGAIHRAAGPALLAECRTLGGCKTGEAKLTRGYNLPAKYVIHTVGPIWQGGGRGEEALLTACYENSLALAAAHGFETVAFPLISAGVYGYPKEQALDVASTAIRRFLETHEMTVWLVLFDREVLHLGLARFRDVRCFVDDRYVEMRENAPSEQHRKFLFQKARESFAGAAPMAVPLAAEAARAERDECAAPDPEELRRLLKERDESFTQMLLRKIDEKGWTDAQCYKKANVDRKHFSKIRSNLNYKPSKPTAVAFALALELSPAEARDLLRKAGYALSNSNTFDIIIDYYLRRRIYDVFKINETLYAYDQPLIG